MPTGTPTCLTPVAMAAIEQRLNGLTSFLFRADIRSLLAHTAALEVEVARLRADLNEAMRDESRVARDAYEDGLAEAHADKFDERW